VTRKIPKVNNESLSRDRNCYFQTTNTIYKNGIYQSIPRGSQGLIRGQRQPFGTAQGLLASRTQRSDIRGLRSGIKLISDLRLLTSPIYAFYDLNAFNGF
jgi:hypothetical protein